ncbi:hypothetical protein Btru_021174 [Bulinus truncatus]|nr:hypothetical protein Btru_021174 [Bulinus truncatus]
MVQISDLSIRDYWSLYIGFDPGRQAENEISWVLVAVVFGDHAANIVTIANFKRQGFQEGVNVTLTALAVSDIGSLAAQIITNMTGSPWIRQVDWFIIKTDLGSVFFYIHGYFMRVSGVITSYAAFERCLCVAMPLKVKWFINRNVSIVVNGAAYVVLSLTLIPPFHVLYFGVKFSPEFNKTFISMYFKDIREEYMPVYYFIEHLFVPYATILVLFICTAVLIRRLNVSAKWRLARTNDVTYKERKLIAMLMTISLMFIALTVPQAALITAVHFVRSLSLDGSLFYVFTFTSSFTALLETFNCSTSIFVYYKMSSKFRSELQLMFRVFKTSDAKFNPAALNKTTSA